MDEKEFSLFFSSFCILYQLYTPYSTDKVCEKSINPYLPFNNRCMGFNRYLSLFGVCGIRNYSWVIHMKNNLMMKYTNMFRQKAWCQR